MIRGGWGDEKDPRATLHCEWIPTRTQASILGKVASHCKVSMLCNDLERVRILAIGLHCQLQLWSQYLEALNERNRDLYDVLMVS